MTALADQTPRRGPLDRARVALGSVGAAVLGVAPHVLHHTGPLTGAALLSGARGTALFAALGLLATTPMLRRLHRHTGAAAAPAAALALFAALFALSSFVISPAITSDDGGSKRTPSGPTPAGHEYHRR